MSKDQQDSEEQQRKQKQAILYAIQKDPSINRTKLMKYVFLIDLFAYNKFDKTILGNNYRCLPNGPVPEYGMNYTDLYNAKIHQNEFQMMKVQEGEYYYYRFALNKGVDPSADMTKIFKPVEMDLIDLTLHTVKFRTASSLSLYTHTLDLWKNRKDYELISLDGFKLSPAQMEELEQLLSTKIYADSVNPKRSISLRQTLSHQNKNKDTQPKRLPVFIDAETGDIIGEGVNDS